MKRSDIALIIVIAASSLLVAYFVMNAVFGKLGREQVKVPTVMTIEQSITEPDPRVFNTEAINPTVQVVIGNPDS